MPDTPKPHLRTYAEMESAGIDWLGLVPAHWEVRRLKGGSRNWFRWLMGLWSRGQQTNVNGELRIG